MNEIVQNYAENLRRMRNARSTALFLQDRGNPEDAANALRLGGELGVPAAAVLAQPERFQFEAEARRTSEIFDRSPVLREWVESDPINGQLAGDDLASLAEWEERLRPPTWRESLTAQGQRFVQGFSGMVEAVPMRRAINDVTTERRIIEQAEQQVAERERQVAEFTEILERGLSPMSGTPMTPEERATYQQRLEDAQIGLQSWNDMGDSGVMPLEMRLAAQLSQDISDWTDETFGVPPEDDSLWSQLAYGAGSMAAFVIPSLAPGGLALTAQLGADAAAVEAYDRAIAAGADERDAEVASVIAGYLGTSEAAPIGAALRRLPSPLRNQFISRFGRVISETAAGSIEEAVQEGFTAIGQNLIARGIYDPEQDILTEDVGTQMLVGALLGGFLSGAVETINPGQSEPRPLAAAPDLDRMGQTGRTAGILGELNDLAGRTQTRTRSPDRFATYLERVGAAEQSVYVPASDFREYAQSQNLTDEELAALGVDVDEMTAMEESGGYVAVPLHQYAARIAGTPAAEWFQQNGVLDPATEMSLAEQQREGQSIMDEAMEQARQMRENEREMRQTERQVYDEVREQLRQAGRTPDVADSEATFFAAFFNSMAMRYGADPFELYERFGLLIQDGGVSQVATDGAVTDNLSDTQTLEQAAAAVQRTPEFQQWFGNSAVRDENGEPLVVYHGTGADIEAFDPGMSGRNSDSGFLGTGVYFSNRGDIASAYTLMGRNSLGSPNVMPVYLSMQNPFMWGEKGQGVRGLVMRGERLPEQIHDEVIRRTGFEFDPDAEPDFAMERVLSDAIRDVLIEQGYDGVVASFDGQPGEFVAFDPSQIKSIFNERPTSDPRIMYQGAEGEAVQFAREFLQELSQVDDLFRYPPAPAGDIGQMFSVVAPEMEYAGNMGAVEIEGREAEQHLFRLPREGAEAADVFVYRGDGEVWFDVSRLTEGEGGSALYAAMADYAFNGGEVFIGDPQGLSDVALLRRTDAMLSSALKHGTTRHLAPHQRQIEGSKDLGVQPLQWRDGDDLANIESLIEVSVANLLRVAPEVADARYDFTTRAFRDAQGERLSDEDLAVWADELGRAGAPRTGSGTLKRGILLNTLLRAESGERPGLLEQVLQQPGQLVERGGLGGTFYQDQAPRQWSEDAAIALRALANEGDSQAIVAQALVDRAGLGPQDFTNVLESVASLSEAERLERIESPALANVLVLMRSAVLEDPQVLDAVVRSVPIDVMNLLAGSEGAAKVALHDEAMLEDGAAFNADLPVPEAVERSRAVRFHVIDVARLAAERALGVANAGREAGEAGAAVIASQSNTLRQNNSPSGPRANIQIPAGGVTSGTTVINLFENRDLSSIIHEAGHYFYEVFATLASDPNAPQQMKDDLAALNEWMGVEQGQTPSVDAQEKFARGMERYTMEGKAPSLALATVFGRFKAWLTNIYRTVRRLNVNLTPEVREVFDRMLATDEEIAQAQADMGARPMFAEAPAGMEQGTWETYQRLERQRTDQANQKMLDRAMADVRRRREQKWKDERKALVDQEMDRLAEEPVYRLFEALANGRWIGNEEAELPPRIDRAVLEEMGVDLNTISRNVLGGNRAIYTTQADEASMHPREAAEFFGFPNVGRMIEALQDAGKRAQRAEERADEIMAQMYPDIMDDASMQAEALEAVHSSRQAEMVALELRHIARQRGQDERRMAARFFQQRARAMIGQMEVRQATNPNRFLTAERQAARKAEQAFATVARGGRNSAQALAEAQQAKEQQLLNHYLYLEARDLERLVSRKREEMRSYDRKEVRERVGSPHIEQIDAILSGYEFRQRSQRQINNSLSLARYVELMDKGGVLRLPSGEEVEFTGGRLDELAIDPRVMEEAQRTHYTRLTVDELRGVFDTVDNIAHVGRRTREVVNARGKRLLGESAARVAGQIRANQRLRDDPEGARGFGQKVINSLSRVDTIAVRMDGGEEFGTFHDEIKREIDLAQGEEQARSVEVMERVQGVFANHYSAKELREFKTERLVPGAGTWTKEQILTLALNTGTESNFQRVMDPRVDESVRMTGDRLDRLLGTLDERDWRFVQDTWDLIDSYYPELAAVNRRMTGVDPKKVDARPMWSGAPSFVRGGYYRLYYDPKKGGGAENVEVQNLMTQGMSAGFGASAQVGNGMTQQRLQTAGGKAVRLDLSGLTQQLRETVRFITLAETVNGTARILNHPEVKQAFRDTGNNDVKRTLDLWLKDIASGPIYNRDWMNIAARFTKNNFTLAMLGFNFKTVFLQVTGLTQSAVTIGPKNMARGLVRFGRNFTTIHREIVAKSPFMMERMSTLQRDIMDFRDEMKTAGPVRGRYERFMDLAAKWSFEPMIRTQFHVVDVPTWLGQYEAALAAGKTEERAVYEADRMVARAQDSALMADRSAVERGTSSETGRQQDTVRFFMTLGGYMLAKMNRANVQILKRQMQIKEADSPALRAVIALKLAADLMVLYAGEAVVMGLLYELMDDDDEYGDLAAYVFAETGSTMVGGVPVVRDIAGSFKGFEGGTYGSVLSMPARATQQIWQGEVDDGLARAALNVVGISTGLPSTATYRVVEQFLGEDDASLGESLFGTNPLNR